MRLLVIAGLGIAGWLFATGCGGDDDDTAGTGGSGGSSSAGKAGSTGNAGSSGKAGSGGAGSGGSSGQSGSAGSSVGVGGEGGSTAGASGAPAGGAAGDGGAGGGTCFELRAIPIDTVEWCYSGESTVVDCLPDADTCTADGRCYRRREDGALFLGLGSSCFNQLSDRWARCTEEENEELRECSVGSAGAGGQVGAGAGGS
jgi:hypothetical protein